ncbi:MAG: hypothetical protein KKB90_09710 [Actinobacteria bacterium]|nr:hypothetical protein [Actinomycetota bacterium]MCG2820132.1 hypothetical protein [Actinomycetes bacterium]MBU4219219.1 hypothetical protein [Actinomycetota bacterium]MBU4359062.1 hypothetical protein [Actinomycetota bacterium]MBU4392927.1 hypothetical protein [Actinomycetota bacterium]
MEMDDFNKPELTGIGAGIFLGPPYENWSEKVEREELLIGKITCVEETVDFQMLPLEKDTPLDIKRLVEDSWPEITASLGKRMESSPSFKPPVVHWDVFESNIRTGKPKLCYRDSEKYYKRRIIVKADLFDFRVIWAD